VILLKGEMLNGRTPKQRTIFESEEPITALGFTESSSKQLSLYIVTTNRILTYLTAGRGHAPPRLLDTLGCALGCVAFREDGEMVAGRDDAIYLYGGESKGGVYAFDGICSNSFSLIIRTKICCDTIQRLHCCYFSSFSRKQKPQKCSPEYSTRSSRCYRAIQDIYS
jgi:hypothetical protein